jgi:guanyl-specific ribonuclease Sa
MLTSWRLRFSMGAIGLIAWVCTSGTGQAQTLTTPDATTARKVEPRRKIPAKVESVLKALDETGKAPAGVMGGRVYENQARQGEQPLPRVDRDGDAITYHTWDVNPRGSERDRGQERLVVGTDGSAYYTTSYYKSFETVRNPSRSVHAVPKPPEPGRNSPAPMPRGDRPRATASNRNAPAEKSVVTLDARTTAKVAPVVDYILAHDAPPPETVGGREYRTLGTEDGEVLPRVDAKGRTIRYREWDVNRKVAGRNRGAERLVTGSDGRAYYTNDHYATFQRIR